MVWGSPWPAESHGTTPAIIVQRKDEVMTPRLLIVEDASDVAENIAFGACLSWPGCAITIASSGQEALRHFLTAGADLIVLDIAIPPPDGFEICRQLRARSEVPILMLTARGDMLDKVRALELGADDYLTKPFDPLELFARLQAMLWRPTMRAPVPGPLGAVDSASPDIAWSRNANVSPLTNTFTIGELSLNFATREVYLRDVPLRLTSTEYRLLEALTRQAGTVLSHRALLKEIWGDDYTGDLQSLKVFIRRLRQKLGDPTERPRYIQNEWGVGYRFIPTADGAPLQDGAA